MLYSFKLSKSNFIYFSVVAALVVVGNILMYGFDGFTLGRIIGSIVGVFLVTFLFALLFWFILGRTEKSGTTTFNVVLTLMLLGIIGNFVQKVNERNRPVTAMKNALSEYKNASKDISDGNPAYSELSAAVGKSIDELIRTSVGDEKELYVVFKGHLVKADSVNIAWNNSNRELAEPSMLDFSLFTDAEEYDRQIRVVKNYIDRSIDYRTFMKNRVAYLESRTKNLNQSNKTVRGFMKGFKDKDATLRPVFDPYINAHIAYGQNLKEIIELLKKEHGKWKLDNDGLMMFENPDSQANYERLLNSTTENEKRVNELSGRINELM